MRFPLALSWERKAVHKTAGWFIPGADPALWLEELVQWGVPLDSIRLHIVPCSLRNRAPSGVLATASGGGLPTPTPRAQPYGLQAGVLYLPADARLDPPVSDAELRHICVWAAAILHPGCGLVGFDAADVRRVGEFIERPSVTPETWAAAVPAPRLAPHIISVLPKVPPSVETVVDGCRDDIGTESPKALAPARGEPKGSLLGRTWAWIRRGGAYTDRSTTRRTWTQTMGLQSRRDQEIEWLQRLLHEDPDVGLRYAIPLTGGGGRGQAPPSTHLHARDPTFKLSDLRGGSAVDSWDARPDVYKRLRQLYRSIANRELALKRYRRAAYIFAKLLGDYVAAASALMEGRHYREAAVLYRDYLVMPGQAALCLEKGGLLLEAIELYRGCALFEKAGDLCARLGQQDDAQEAWREAARQDQRNGRYLAAAQLLERKVGVPDEALGVLDEGWPASSQAEACLREWFGLIGRLGRHEDARHRIRVCLDSRAGKRIDTKVVAVLSAVSADYPDHGIRGEAADATRVIVGLTLPRASRGETEELLTYLRTLAPEDRLLISDTVRYESTLRRRSVSSSRRKFAVLTPELVSEFRLPSGFSWLKLRPAGNQFFAVGLHIENREVCFLRGTWGGTYETFLLGTTTSRSGLLLEPSPDSRLFTLVGFAGAVPRVKNQSLPKSSMFPLEMRVGTPPWIPAGMMAWCYGDSSTLWTVFAKDDTLILANHAPNGYIRATYETPFAARSRSAMAPSVLIAAHQNIVYVAAGRTDIARFHSCSTPTVIPNHCAVRALEAQCWHTRLRIAAAMSEGVTVLLDRPGSRQSIADGVKNPLAAFTTDGFLVVLGGPKGEVYKEEQGLFKCCAHFQAPPADTTALTHAAHAGRFAVCSSSGGVRVYQISIR